jgi:O-antigen ligase/tetratricopeptide (TPR) repeat protein
MKSRADTGFVVMQWLVILALAGTSLVFVVNVNDSTMLKRPILYVTAGLLSATWVSFSMRRSNIQRSFTTVDVAVPVYAALAAISLFGAPNLTLGGIGVVDLVCYLIIFTVSTELFQDLEFTKRILTSLIVVTILASLAAIYQLFSLNGSAAITTGRETISTFGNVTYFAGFLAPMIAIISARLLASKRLEDRIPLGLLLAVIIYLLITTEARSAWAGAAAGIFLLVFLNVRAVKTRWIVLGSLLAVGILIFVTFPGMVQRRLFAVLEWSPTSSIARRPFFYKGAWNAFLASPLFGQGIGNFAVFLPKFRSPEYWMAHSEDIVPHAHNEYLEILSETGLAGFLGFMTIVVLTIRAAGARLKQTEPGDRIFVTGLLCAVAAILVDNLGSMNLRTIPVALLFWILLALLHAMSTTGGRSFSISPPQWAKSMHLAPYLLFGALMAWYVPRQVEHYRAQKFCLAGNLLRTEGRLTEALSMYRETVAHDPDLAEARIYLAANLAQLGRNEEARRHADTILMKNPHYPMARFIQAIADFQLGDTMRATRTMDEELRLETSPQTVYYASLFRRKMNQPDSEFAYIKTLLQNSVRSGSVEYVKEGLGSLADICRRPGTSEECADLVSGIRRTFAKDLSLLLIVEDYYEAVGLLVEARSTLEQAQAIRPDDVEIRNRLARLAIAERAAMEGARHK